MPGFDPDYTGRGWYFSSIWGSYPPYRHTWHEQQTTPPLQSLFHSIFTGTLYSVVAEFYMLQVYYAHTWSRLHDLHFVAIKLLLSTTPTGQVRGQPSLCNAHSVHNGHRHVWTRKSQAEKWHRECSGKVIHSPGSAVHVTQLSPGQWIVLVKPHLLYCLVSRKVLQVAMLNDSIKYMDNPGIMVLLTGDGAGLTVSSSN